MRKKEPKKVAVKRPSTICVCCICGNVHSGSVCPGRASPWHLKPLDERKSDGRNEAGN